MALPELNTARYSMVIPSTGQTVKYRPYLVKEEKILMMRQSSKSTTSWAMPCFNASRLG